MDKIQVIPKNVDGFTSISDATWKNITIPTKNIFPLLRSSTELNMLIYEKFRYNFRHIDGCVIKLAHAPQLFYPKVDILTNQETLDHKEPQDMFSKFCRNNFIIPDPPSDYLYRSRKDYDAQLSKSFSDIPLIKNYIEMSRRRGSANSPKEFMQLRKRLYDDLWLGSQNYSQNDISLMLEQIINKERDYFKYGVPLVPVCNDEKLYVQKARQVNETCQAISSYNSIECATNFVFTKQALINDEIMAEYYNYVKNNNWATLNMVKFIGFEIHDLDINARQKYFEFMSEIAEIKEAKPKKLFMLLEGGNHGYLSMQVFDIVSRSLTGVDIEGGFGGNGIGNWYDDKLMITVPHHLGYKTVNKTHCPTCQTITEQDFFHKSLNIKRRKHMMYDLDKKASGICEAVKTKTVKPHMLSVLKNSEFSGLQEYLLNQ